MIDVVAKRIWFLGFSLVIFVIGIISLAIPPNLNLGIDFLSGTGITVSFEKEINTEQIQSEFNSLGLSSTNTQSLGNDTFFIRTERLSDFSNSDDTSNVSREDVENSLKKIDDQYKILEVETVGSKVAEGTIRNSIVAVTVSSLFVMIYILYAFRKLENSIRFALSAVFTLIHDVILVTGLYALLGHLFGLQVNSVFIVAILTVIGYSVNDTIVIFDRIRENNLKFSSSSISQNINRSINESITRSLGTSITTLLVLLSMLLLGGSTLRDFLVVLILGVIVGTYSSIFVASQFLVFWEQGFRNKNL
ncbi:MAG: protein translocase subunit SecF [Chloroflexota bacterium]|nr:protein translocase subunit SecF [Chloroflexota bacterium]MEC9451383.1 protein translocase subunit SecF [Chloroflexota bacterium]MQG04787.1 protein translocase subunit SecF [SAR202 cluster bacterium]|tara:strand:+ start:2950 stop:3867 length:918 start_codon:yes stop_codon:yes gene_type:complete